jgi:hypothetical protein
MYGPAPDPVPLRYVLSENIHLATNNGVRGLPDGVIGSKIKTLYWNFPDGCPQDLVNNAHAEAGGNVKEVGSEHKFRCSHSDDISILILTDELGNYSKIRERALSVCNPHYAVHAFMERAGRRNIVGINEHDTYKLTLPPEKESALCQEAYCNDEQIMTFSRVILRSDQSMKQLLIRRKRD